MVYKCDCCGINTATFKDFRDYPSGSHSIQPWVCIQCLNLNDYWFFKLYRAEQGEEKNKIIEHLLTETGLEEWPIVKGA